MQHDATICNVTENASETAGPKSRPGQALRGANAAGREVCCTIAITNRQSVRACQLRVDVGELAVDLRVFLAVGIDRSDSVQDGRVVSTAEVAADFLQAVARVAAGEEHADLSGERDALVTL